MSKCQNFHLCENSLAGARRVCSERRLLQPVLDMFALLCSLNVPSTGASASSGVVTMRQSSTGPDGAASEGGLGQQFTTSWPVEATAQTAQRMARKISAFLGSWNLTSSATATMGSSSPTAGPPTSAPPVQQPPLVQVVAPPASAPSAMLQPPPSSPMRGGVAASRSQSLESSGRRLRSSPARSTHSDQHINTQVTPRCVSRISERFPLLRGPGQAPVVRLFRTRLVLAGIRLTGVNVRCRLRRSAFFGRSPTSWTLWC